MPDGTAVCHIPLGLMPYDEALRRQQAAAQALLADETEQQTLYTVEHPPTLTIGRNGSRANIVASENELQAAGFAVFDVDRGGDVTYHGPGQLVVYPILHLNPWANDVGRYVRMLEQVIIDALAEGGVQGQRDSEHPGVWVGADKICAVGCRVKRRTTGEFVTSHGFALNIHTNLAHFETIVPCGIHNRGVTSLERLLPVGSPVELYAQWRKRVLHHFAEVFGCAVHGLAEGEISGGQPA